MQPRSVIELSQSAFNYNIENLKKASGEAALAVVVKGNAYGHGMKEISKMAQDNPLVSWICTAGLQEAIQLRIWGITKPLLVLSYFDAEFEAAIIHNIHLMIATLDDALACNAAAARIGKKAFIHIKVDTGMSRLGVLPEDASSFAGKLLALEHLELYGLATHLCDTPNPDQSFTIFQLKTLDAVQELFTSRGMRFQAIHAQSSSALCVRAPNSYTIVRAGAAIYGIWKTDEHKERIQELHPGFDLRPVMQWKTRIIQLKTIPAGSTVGYNRTYKAERNSLIAIAPIGYYDGYHRGFSNRGYALINNQLAPVAGIVSMNMTAFDVTDLINITQHHEIILMGDADGIKAHECARMAGIITNEMVTSINSSIERMVVPAHTPLRTDAYNNPKAATLTPIYARNQS